MPILDKPKWELFAQNLAQGMSANQAYERAGYRPNDSNCIKLKNCQEVQDRVKELLGAIAEKKLVTVEDVLRELLLIAKVDIAKAYGENGKLLSIHEIPEDTRRAIAGIEVEELFEGQGRDKKQIGFTTKVKFWDKPRCLELLGKHLEMFIERHKHSDSDGKPLNRPQVIIKIPHNGRK